ncbi:hypothetical protein ACI2OX_08310 [Bacillus sp. N9]
MLVVNNKHRKKWRTIFTYVSLSVIAVIMLWPFVWMVITSFKPNTEMFAYPPKLIPSELTFDHYIQAWKAAPWGRFFLTRHMLL